MRTNIDIDDALLAEAMAATGLKTKRKVVEAGLRLLARHKRQTDARKLFGRIRWEAISTGNVWTSRISLIAAERAGRQVWIDHLRGVRKRENAVLDILLEQRYPQFEQQEQESAADLIVGDPVLCEVADPGDHAAVKDVLLSFEAATIGGAELALRVADHYRALRRRGVTVRKTIDLLIGTFSSLTTACCCTATAISTP